MGRRYFDSICLKRAGPSGDVRVFGRLDGEFVWTTGFSPGVLQLLVPRSEFSKLGGDYTGGVDVEFYFRNDPAQQTPDFTLRDWSIWDAEETDWGQDQASGATGVMERRLTLLDFRRIYRRGQGGLLTVGILNETKPSGNTPTDPDDPNRPLVSLYDAIVICLDAMQLQSLIAYVPDGLRVLTAPRDLDWRGAHAPTELAKLLEMADLVFCPQADGTPTINLIDPTRPITIPDSVNEPAGDGEPAASHELPWETLQLAEDRPGLVIITSAPAYSIKQTSLIGINAAALDFVGLETDGTLKPLGQLSYSGGSAQTLSQAIADGWQFGDADAYMAAQRSAFRFLQVSHQPQGGSPNVNKRRLPILTRLAEIGYVVGAAQSQVERYLRPALFAKCAMLDNGGWRNQMQRRLIPCDLFDARTGTVRSEIILGTVEPNPADSPTRGFVGLQGADDVELRFAHEARDEDEPHKQFYVSVWTTSDTGQIVQIQNEPDVLAALANPASFVVSAPELRAFVVDGIQVNRFWLDKHAEQMAGSVLSRGVRQVATRRFRGFHLFNPSGQISEVRISQDQLLTAIDVNRHFLPRARLATDKVFRTIQEAAMNVSRHRADPVAASLGTQQYAAPVSDRVSLPEDGSFWAEISGGGPLHYDWIERLPSGYAGPRNSGTHGLIENVAARTQRLRPDSTNANVQYVDIPVGTYVRVMCYDPFISKYVIDVPPVSVKGPC